MKATHAVHRHRNPTVKWVHPAVFADHITRDRNVLETLWLPPFQSEDVVPLVQEG